MSNIIWSRVIVEFIGTLVFLSVIMNVAFKGNEKVMAPLVIGIGLTAAIYMFAGLGDCHLNPAVSTMAYLSGQISLAVLAAYVVAQLAGAGASYLLYNNLMKI